MPAADSLNVKQQPVTYMQYAECRAGRVFVLRIDDGEDILEVLRDFLIETGVSAAVIQIIGALRGGMMVTGPREPVLPPVPVREEIAGGSELLGFGTVYPGVQGPAIHLHAATGRGRETRTGCVRETARTYLVVEAIITELVGINAVRELDERTGVTLPVFREEKVL